MPTPSAFGPVFAPATSGFVSSFPAGSIDLGTSGSVWIAGQTFASGGSGNTGRPGVVTVGGVALTNGVRIDRNAAPPNGLGGGGGWNLDVAGLVTGLTGLQPVVVTQIDGAGAPSTSGSLTIRLQAYIDVTSVPVRNVVPPPSNSNAISSTFASAVGRLDVLSVSTSMASTGGALGIAATSGTLRTSATPGNNDTVLMDRPGAASAVFGANVTNSFSFSWFGVQYSLAGSAAAGPTITTQPSPQAVLAGQTATFTVAVNLAGGTATYTWLDGGVAIGSAPNAATYARSTVQADNGKQISVSVTVAGGTTPGTVVSNTALLTVNAAASPPVMTGALALPSLGYRLSWAAATNSPAGYEVSVDAGATYVNVGNVLNTDITNRTPGTTDQVRVRAYNAGGDRAAPLSGSVQLSTSGAVSSGALILVTIL